jgi:hypothetical protein
MRQYLLSIYMPDADPPSSVDLDRIMAELRALQDEMRSAGVWVFSNGLHPPSSATVLRMRGGEVLMTDGPYIEGKEHLGGLTIIEAPDLDAALPWARRITEITTLPVEVRPFAEDH